MEVIGLDRLYATGQKEAISINFNIFIEDPSLKVTDAALYQSLSVFPLVRNCICGKEPYDSAASQEN
ncbi:unnamed protein product [Arabis nemorensis]|uniref:Uncharacterized protein n=1 Tax=Arabis nemorensis TaxID=586526 RepID=A0A565C605_9BRAS|nr:unnamed protein product [Arabis nemorensis]